MSRGPRHYHARMSSLSLRVWALVLSLAGVASAQHRVAGAVRWPDRRGAAGAEVLVRWRMHPELPGLVGFSLGEEGVATARAVVGEDGRWQFDAPVRGPFEVAARSADGAAVSLRAFPVMAGGYVDMALGAPFVVAGTVRDAAGAPLPGLQVRFEPMRTTWSRLACYGLPSTHGTATTDAQGRFTFRLDADYLQHPYWEPFLMPTLADPTRAFQREHLLRPSAANRDLQLVVVDSELEVGALTDHDGRGVPCASVFRASTPWRRSLSGDDGSFVIAKAGDAVVATAADRPPALGEPTLRLPAPHRIDVRLRDAEGAPLANCDVLWATMLHEGPGVEAAARTDAAGRVTYLAGSGALAGFALVGGVYQQFLLLRPEGDVERSLVVAPRPVRGTVVDAGGTPVAAARLVAHVATAVMPGLAECVWVTYTDHGGRYEFPTLPAEPLSLSVDAGTNGLVSARLDAHEQVRDFALPLAGAVEIEVSMPDGEPAPRAWITLVRSGGVRADMPPAPAFSSTALVGFTDGQGRVRFTGLPDGAWSVIGNCLVDGAWYGGGRDVATDGERAQLVMRRLIE